MIAHLFSPVFHTSGKEVGWAQRLVAPPTCIPPPPSLLLQDLKSLHLCDWIIRLPWAPVVAMRRYPAVLFASTWNQCPCAITSSITHLFPVFRSRSFQTFQPTTLKITVSETLQFLGVSLSILVWSGEGLIYPTGGGGSPSVDFISQLWLWLQWTAVSGKSPSLQLLYHKHWFWDWLGLYLYNTWD